MARILLVNDEVDLVEISAMVLREAGHEVTSLIDGRKAAQTALVTCPDMLILDWSLRGITAEDVLRQLRVDDRTAKLPVLLISALADGAMKARLYGVDGFLQKPFDGNALLRSVDEVLARTSHADAQPRANV